MTHGEAGYYMVGGRIVASNSRPVTIAGSVLDRSTHYVARAALEHKDVTLEDRAVVAAALETFRSQPVLGFTDCLLLEVARKAGHLPLGTFDRNLGKVEGTIKL
jgi:predicted nucleic acid-binding protein